jgi:hypothetical protein
MLPFSPLAILPLLISTPEWPSSSFQNSELGGTVVGHTIASPVPITLNLYAGTELVASTQADLFGRYTLSSPPGDYWLQLNIGGHEARVERVLMRAGSWNHDFDVGLAPPDQPPAMARSELAAEVCGEIQGRNGRGISATVLAYTDDRCTSGTRADVRGRYCLRISPGTYWLRATSAGVDVAYERVRVPPGSLLLDVRSVVEVIELPPLEVTARSGGDHRVRG